MIQRQVRDNEIVADFFSDVVAGKRKTVIMLGGSEGGKSFSGLIWKQQVVRRLVQQGFNVLSLAYFNAPGLPTSLEEIPLEYFEKTFSWLARQKEVYPNEYALIGASKGAEIALLLGSRYKQIKVVIGLSPSSVIWQGIPFIRFSIGMNPKSSWSHEGEGLPYVPSSLSAKDWVALLILRLRKIAERDLENAIQLTETTIPVEKTEGNILLVSASKDQVWPSTFMGNQITKRLADNEFAYQYKHVAYDMGHTRLMMNKRVWRIVFSFLEEQFN